MFYPMNQYKSYLKYCSNRRVQRKEVKIESMNKKLSIESRRIGPQLSELDPQGYNLIVHILDVYSYTQGAALMYVNVM